MLSRQSAALTGIAVILAVTTASASAKPQRSSDAVPPPPPPPPAADVSFQLLTEGFVPSGFHPRYNRNRVFYAGSAREARPWVQFTGIGRVNYSQYGLLAIFYRQAPTGAPRIDSISALLSAPSALNVVVKDLPISGHIPSIWRRFPVGAWGWFTVNLITKSSLPAHPKKISVWEVPGQ
jgi:hypothetical protein